MVTFTRMFTNSMVLFLTFTASTVTVVRGEIAPEISILFLFFAFFVGALLTFMLTHYAPNLPYTVILFVVGVCFSGIFSSVASDDLLKQSVDTWNSINPELILYIFLPALVFQESMSLNFHHVRSVLLPSAFLAIPIALLGVGGFAWILHMILPYHWTWKLSLLFSAITCATDPMSVVPLLKKCGASPRLTYLITGEALIKDATTLAIYHLLFHLIQSHIDEHLSSSDIILFIARVLLISPLIGIAFGMATVVGLLITHNRMKEEDTIVQMALTMCCAYISFFVAEYMLHVSGVLATCAAGIVLCRFAKPLYLQPEAIHAIWSAAEWIANTMIFLLSGIIIGARTIMYVNAIDWGYLFIIYGILNLVRFLTFLLAHPFVSYTLHGYLWKEAVFASWIGLRGAVSMALAMSLTESILRNETVVTIEEAHRIFFYVGGLASLTLLINATTATTLLQSFGLANDASVSVEAKIIFQYIRKRMKLKALNLLEDIQAKCSQDTYFIDINIVAKYCRILREDEGDVKQVRDELKDILREPSPEKLHRTESLAAVAVSAIAEAMGSLPPSSFSTDMISDSISARDRFKLRQQKSQQRLNNRQSTSNVPPTDVLPPSSDTVEKDSSPASTVIETSEKSNRVVNQSITVFPPSITHPLSERPFGILKTASVDLHTLPIPEDQPFEEQPTTPSSKRNKRKSTKSKKPAGSRMSKQDLSSLQLSDMVDEEVEDNLDDEDDEENEEDAFNASRSFELRPNHQNYQPFASYGSYDHRHVAFHDGSETSMSGLGESDAVYHASPARSRPISRQYGSSTNGSQPTLSPYQNSFHSLVHDQFQKIRSVDASRRSFAVQKCLSTDSSFYQPNNSSAVYPVSISRLPSMDVGSYNNFNSYLQAQQPLFSLGSFSTASMDFRQQPWSLQSMSISDQQPGPLLRILSNNGKFKEATRVNRSGFNLLSTENSAKVIPVDTDSAVMNDTNVQDIENQQKMVQLAIKESNSNSNRIVTSEVLHAALESHIRSSLSERSETEMGQHAFIVPMSTGSNSDRRPDTSHSQTYSDTFADNTSGSIQMLPTVVKKNSWIEGSPMVVNGDKKPPLPLPTTTELLKLPIAGGATTLSPVINPTSVPLKPIIKRASLEDPGLEPDAQLMASPFLISPASPAEGTLPVHVQTPTTHSNTTVGIAHQTTPASQGKHFFSSKPSTNTVSFHPNDENENVIGKESMTDEAFLSTYTNTQVDLSMFARRELSIDLLHQIRKAFLDMVRVNYWRQIHSGKLPRETPAILILLNSIDHGLDHITEVDGFADWEYIERACREVFDDPLNLRAPATTATTKDTIEKHDEKKKGFSEEKEDEDEETSVPIQHTNIVSRMVHWATKILPSTPTSPSLHHRHHPSQYAYPPGESHKHLSAAAAAVSTDALYVTDDIENFVQPGSLSPTQSVLLSPHNAQQPAVEKKSLHDTFTTTFSSTVGDMKERLVPSLPTPFPTTKGKGNIHSHEPIKLIPFIHSIIRDHQASLWITILTSFIEAHEYAQRKIPFYLGDTEEIDTIEEAIVVQESMDVTKYVKSILLQLDPALIIQQVSKQTAYWILHLQQDQIEEFTSEGILNENDAELLLDEIDEDLSLLFYGHARSHHHNFLMFTSQSSSSLPPSNDDHGVGMSQQGSGKQQYRRPQRMKSLRQQSRFWAGDPKQQAIQSSSCLNAYILENDMLYTMFYHLVIITWHGYHRTRMFLWRCVYRMYIFFAYLLYVTLRCRLMVFGISSMSTVIPPSTTSTTIQQTIPPKAFKST